MKEIAEALTEAQTFIEKIHNAFADSQGDISIHELRKTISVVNSALAKPLRNCDVGTAEEQIERHHKTYCREYNSTPSCLTHNGSCALCFARWSQTPYNDDTKDNDDELYCCLECASDVYRREV